MWSQFASTFNPAGDIYLSTPEDLQDTQPGIALSS